MRCKHCDREKWIRHKCGLCNGCYDHNATRHLYVKPRSSDAPPCRHCHDAPGNRPRGLCWSCYADNTIRALYPTTSANRLPARKRLLPEPTDALPGTAEKVAVLAARFAAGEHLWHPDDVTLDAAILQCA